MRTVAAMAMLLQNLLMRSVDLVYAALPRRLPSHDQLRTCKIISHRGEHDNRAIFENTLAAFRVAREAGAWGIECDLRWTRDLVPMVIHDSDTTRLFNESAVVAELDHADLRQRIPQIPSLAELVEEFGGNTHLMLEIKAEHYPDPPRQQQILADTLLALQPGQDYHFLALDPALFQRVSFVPQKYCLPVSQLNTAHLSGVSLAQGFAGLAGHFYLLSRHRQLQHEANGQKIGTGFVASRRSLYRELNRGAEWIFSNHAVKLLNIRDRELGTKRADKNAG